MLSKMMIDRRSMDSRPQPNQVLSSVLKWLWEVAIGPVLHHLGCLRLEGRDSQKLPRIHWVSAGLIGALPLHAAGIYTKSGNVKQHTSTYAVSSHKPSTQALAAARRKSMQPLASKKDRILSVGMKKTPSFHDLNVEQECSAIAVALHDETGQPIITFEPSCLGVNDSFKPTANKVKNMLPDVDAVHFVCHGVAHPKDPLYSALIVGGHTVYKGYSYPLMLSVNDISNLDPSRARLAYLSACVTATTSDSDAFDETLHVASMFQTVGVPHVIGTLWEVDDNLYSCASFAHCK